MSDSHDGFAMPNGDTMNGHRHRNIMPTDDDHSVSSFLTEDESITGGERDGHKIQKENESLMKLMKDLGVDLSPKRGRLLQRETPFEAFRRKWFRLKFAPIFFIFIFFPLTMIGNNRRISHFKSSSSAETPETLFFNSAPDNHKAPLSSKHYPRGGPVIVTWVTNRTNEVENLQTAIRSLAFFSSDDPDHPTPILVFNDGYLTPSQIHSIFDITTRPISFPSIDLTDFPPGFRLKKNVVDYYGEQMNRFWITTLWKHPALDHFETIMRLSSESCFKRENSDLPYFARDHLLYHSLYAGFEAGGMRFLQGLHDFVTWYVLQAKLKPRNPYSWQFIYNSWMTRKKIPIFNTNFEIVRKSFMQRDDVREFHDTLTEVRPFPVLKKRWSVHSVRFMMMAIFAEDELVMKSRPEGYFTKEECDRADVLRALERYYRKGD